MRALPLLFFTVDAGGCQRGAVPAMNPQAEVAVSVDNQNFLDMNVFLIRGGQRIRLGTVPGLSSRILMVRPDLIGYGTELQFELHPIGGRANPPPPTTPARPRAGLQR